MRLLPALAVAAAVALAPGLALADPGNGKGNGITNNPKVPPGQSKKDSTAPQSPAKVDHGANVPGPDDSVRDESPSQNGNGTGQTKGTPCAGCVGKPLQAPLETPPATPQEIMQVIPQATPQLPAPTIQAGGAPPAPQAPAAAPEVAKGLAFTGLNLLPLGLAGILLVGGGGAAVVMAGQSRRP
ncbi:hypothetical protein PV646_35825 [Streptomyces sp. ID05-26A]|nr:hypothetical protein [Streptomyces sp. ID05-26A]